MKKMTLRKKILKIFIEQPNLDPYLEKKVAHDDAGSAPFGGGAAPSFNFFGPAAVQDRVQKKFENFSI